MKRNILKAIALTLLIAFVFGNLIVVAEEEQIHYDEEVLNDISALIDVPETDAYDNIDSLDLPSEPEQSEIAAEPLSNLELFAASDNLALGKSASALSAGEPASNAVDGNSATYWQAGNGEGWTFLQVDLGDPSITITEAFIVLNSPTRIHSMFAEATSNLDSFSRLVDNGSFKDLEKGGLRTLFEISEPEAPELNNSFVFDLETARYFRLYMLRGYDGAKEGYTQNCRVSEVELRYTPPHATLERLLVAVEVEIAKIEKISYGDIDQNWLTELQTLFSEAKYKLESGTPLEVNDMIKATRQALKQFLDYAIEFRYGNDWITVPPPNFTKISPDAFPDYMWERDCYGNKERNLIWYYANFHILANAVKKLYPNNGFIDVSVWREFYANNSYNARVQENHIAFAFFYTTNEPWNIYYNKPEIRARLEMVLEHLLSLQKVANDTTDGQFPEYSIAGYNLSATAFFTKFIGQTIRFLNEAEKNDPNFISIDSFLMERTVAAQKKAIMSVLSDDSFWNEGKKLYSQWEAVLPGALAYLQYNDDATVLSSLTSQIGAAYNNLQSSAGYYYENNMPDWFHNMNTHISNINDAWTFLRSNPKYDSLRSIVTKNESFFWEWVSYNVIADGDLDVFAMNAGISSRAGLSHLTQIDCGIAEVIPIARAFLRTIKEKRKDRLSEMANYTKMWPAFPSIKLGETMGYSPFAFLVKSNFEYHPTEQEREVAISLLPYMTGASFNHIRKDARRNLTFSFYRRPMYYVVFNEGATAYNRQNMGLGLVWHPEGGVFINSQSENNSNADSDGFPDFLNIEWGTREYTVNRPMKESAPFEASSIAASYSINGAPYSVVEGSGNISGGDVTLSYGIGNGGVRGNKTVTFKDGEINVSIWGYNGTPGSSVAHPTRFIECIPLMVRKGDKFESANGYFKLTRGRAVMEITFDSNADFSMESKPVSFGKYEMTMMMITADTKLDYTLRFLTQEPSLRANGNTLLDYNSINNIYIGNL